MLVKLLQHNGSLLSEVSIPNFDRRPDVIIYGIRTFSFAHENLVKSVKHYIYRECQAYNLSNQDTE